MGLCDLALQKLYYVYGLDTACFYDDEENYIEKRLLKARHLKSRLKVKYPSMNDLKKAGKFKTYNFLNKFIGEQKQRLKGLLRKNIDCVRAVREDKILNGEGEPSLRRRVSIFDSMLTRCFGLKEREFNTEIVIVKVYFFDVAESIVNHGFYMNGQKYVFFSASAGQIRTKKLVAVREDLLNANLNTLTAGLSIDSINAQGGMNVNKFLAYLALCNSATDEWNEFDIDRCIVVDDFENVVRGIVDFIDDKTYEITRQEMNMDFNQTDGCGMILPCLSDRNFMVRLPWVKGLLAKFDFVRFIREKNGNRIVKDVYGDEHDIIDENIRIIFTKSQFKMWKFYRNWTEYKDNFKKYHCVAGKCNVEENVFPNSVINYQMIQTLSDLTDDEIKALGNQNEKDLTDLASDMRTMLKVFGAATWNTNKTSFQKCLEKYPELLSDSHSRQTLRDIKISLEKDLWSARFDICGKYTFVIPDLYAFCEHLFLGIDDPRGILNDGEVCCKLYGNEDKLDCLRSPHLYREHPVRINNTSSEWFDTKAIYISCHDLISRVVQCDFDGDRLLVSNNKTLVKAAERNMEGIVPLFYNMSKANAEELTPSSLFKGLLLAYNGGNIGAPSNDITKIWNSGEITEEKLKVIKWLVMNVNFTIDYAKTLYKPVVPDYVNEIIVKYTKSKVPHFFMYAKGKKRSQVEDLSDNVVDRIEGLFPSKKLNFNFKQNNIGSLDYRVLMKNPDIGVDDEIVKRFKCVVSKLNFNNVDDKKMHTYLATYENAKREIVGSDSLNDVVDHVIWDLFSAHKSAKKKAFWVLFGDVVYENICNNIDNDFVQCERCRKRFYKTANHQKYCKKCQGYIKQGVKTLVCVDCGKEFEVTSKNTQSVRCCDCRLAYKRERDRIRQRKYRMIGKVTRTI